MELEKSYDLKGSTINLMGGLNYEFDFSPVRFSFGPAVGFLNLNWKGKELISRLGPYMYIYGQAIRLPYFAEVDVEITGSSFTYGGVAKLVYDYDESMYFSAEYKFLGFSDEMIKDYNAHVLTVAVGWKF